MLRSRPLRQSSSTRVDPKFPKQHQSSFHNPEQQPTSLFHTCQCSLCHNKQIFKYSSHPDLSRNKPSSLCTFDKSSLQILLSALLGKNKKKGLNINIPQTCFYKNGKPNTLFIHNLQQIKSISVKKHTSRQVLQDFLKRRLQARLSTNEMNQKASKELSELHEKVFEKIHPSHLQFATSTELKEKIYIIHKHNKIQILQQQSETNGQCCVSYFSDGSISLLTEDQFKTIRNDSKYFHSLQYLQLLTPSTQNIISQFDQYSCITNSSLFNTSRHQIDTLLQPTSLFHKPSPNSDIYQQFHRTLLPNSHQLCLYQTFKIVHYITKTSNLIIYSLKLNWSITKQRQIYLLNVISMNYRRRQTDEVRQILGRQFEMIKSKDSGQLKEIEFMRGIMLEKWRRMKQENNLEEEPADEEGQEKGRGKRELGELRVSVGVRPNRIFPKLFKNRSGTSRQFI